MSDRPEPFVSEQFHTVYATAICDLYGEWLIEYSVNCSMLIGISLQYAIQPRRRGKIGKKDQNEGTYDKKGGYWYYFGPIYR